MVLSALIFSIFTINLLFAQEIELSTLYLQDGDTARGIVIEIGDEYIDFEQVFPDGVRARQKILVSKVYKLVSPDGNVLIRHPRIKEGFERPTEEITDKLREYVKRIKPPEEEPPEVVPEEVEPIPEDEPSLLFEPEKREVIKPARASEDAEAEPVLEPILTMSKIIAMAEADARRDHNVARWGAWGRKGCLVSLGSAVLGGQIGGAIAEFPGFLIGTGIGAISTPMLVAIISTRLHAPPPELRAASSEQLASYRRAYLYEARRLRIQSIYRAEIEVLRPVIKGTDEPPEEGVVEPLLDTHSPEAHIIAMARADARKNHNGAAWGFCGGSMSCGVMLFGGIVGGEMAEVPGFFVGVGIGGIVIPILMSSISTKTIAPTPNLKDVSQEQLEFYRKAYMDETRKLRRTSIFLGEVGLAALAGLGLFVLM